MTCARGEKRDLDKALSAGLLEIREDVRHRTDYRCDHPRHPSFALDSPPLFTDFVDAVGTVYFDQSGEPVRIIIHWEHHSNDTNSVTGLTLHEHGHFTETIDLLSGTDTITSNEEVMNRPGTGVVVQDVGKVVYDADGNLVFFAGGRNHSGVLLGDEVLCAALA